MAPVVHPPFSLIQPLYDQSTMLGRAKQFYTITDPRSMFYSKNQVQTAEELLASFRRGSLPPTITDSQLWNARRIVESVVHPDTGKPINPLLRFSCYAPMNIFIVSAMVLPSTINSIPRTIFIHWFNQSYNAAVNYTNGAGVESVPTDRLFQGYVGAVGASLGIALGATYITKRAANLSVMARTLIRAVLPFSAVVGAGCVNVALIRRNEITEGVLVFDKYNDPHGKSPIAGKRGIWECCLARFAWNIPAMVCPTIFMGYMSTKPWWMALNPRLRLITEVGLIAGALMLGVPPALGLFPQRETISSSNLEEKFHNITDRNGNKIEKLYFNKGL